MTALDWGWNIEETATRLMEASAKARENGERYAAITAQNAQRPWSETDKGRAGDEAREIRIDESH